MNVFYNHTSGVPAAQTRGASSNVKSEFDLIQAGFDQVGVTLNAPTSLAVHAAPAKTTPVDADEFAITNSVSTPTAYGLAKVTLANIKATLLTYFSALTGTWAISTTGNAATATKLATARTIGGTSFDGSVNITPANATNATNATNAETVTTTVASGAVGTTQSINDSTTKIATTAFVNPGSSIAQTGWRKEPDGLIVMWGYVASVTASTAVTFPNGGFPNNLFGVTATIFGSNAIAVSVLSGYSKTQMTLSLSGTSPVFWEAKGN